MGDSKLKSLKGNDLLMGMPDIWFFIISAVILTAGWMGILPSGMVGGFALFMSLGYLIRYVYWKIPLIKNTLGLASISLTCAIIQYFGIWPENIVDTMSEFVNGSCDFLSWFIAALIVGNILGMNRKVLIKAGIRYFIPVLGGVACAYAFGGLVGAMFGMSVRDTLLYIAGPIMGGGTGAGAVPMSEMYAKAFNLTTDVTFAKLYPSINIGEWIAIFSAIALNMIGKKRPSLTGNGSLMKASNGENLDGKEKFPFIMALSDLGIGLFVTMAFFIFGRILNHFVPSLHYYAWTIIAVAACKISNILPSRIEYAAVKWTEFAQGTFTICLSAGIGIAMLNLGTLLESLMQPGYIFVCFAVVMGAIVGAGLGGVAVKFYFIESAITAGLCMANCGGSGDIMVLSSCDRMELMSFAQISSRVGGALILIIQSILLALLI